ncbi:BTE_collapsed_G0004420.mRNA.1.CDS.1 [Saccharomyces cerevisiae]|nr:BTE_collapsed_G0004420.mRNA.1.CDS.1 [Saccharomyces cerevisiae]
MASSYSFVEFFIFCCDFYHVVSIHVYSVLLGWFYSSCFHSDVSIIVFSWCLLLVEILCILGD